MNCSQAKQISINEYLLRKGVRPVRSFAHDIAYRAPYREDHTPSLMVSKDGKLFKDWGDDQAKGTIVDLAMLMCHTSIVADALRDIETTMCGVGCMHVRQDFVIPRAKKEEIMCVHALVSQNLIAYGISRGIPQEILRDHCCEVVVASKYTYLGWANRSGGYELRREGNDAFSKRCIGKKDISILGNVQGSVCLVFEGFFDLLSSYAMGWLPRDGYSAIVLNSTSLTAHAIPILAGAAEIHLWLDADKSGRDATRTIMEAMPTAKDCSAFLAGQNDVNDFLLFARKSESDK